jgi:hypothetical protein
LVITSGFGDWAGPSGYHDVNVVDFQQLAKFFKKWAPRYDEVFNEKMAAANPYYK